MELIHHSSDLFLCSIVGNQSSYFCHLLLFLQPSTDAFLRVLAGDEVVQVNDQIVVSGAVTPCTFGDLSTELYHIGLNLRSSFLPSVSASKSITFRQK